MSVGEDERSKCEGCGRTKVQLKAWWMGAFDIRPSMCVFCESEYVANLLAEHPHVRIEIGPVQG